MSNRTLMLLLVGTVGCANQARLRDLREERDEARQGLASALKTIRTYEAIYGPLPALYGSAAPQWSVLEVRE